MNYSAKNLIKVLEQKGFYFKRANGSHFLYFNPVTGKTLIVPVHGKDDLSKGLFFSLPKQAGINRDEI